VRGREAIAASSALGAYLTTVLPRLRRELGRWRAEAAAIPDPAARDTALAALDEKASNVEAVAVFATLAPRQQRGEAVRAIAALQIDIDYVDALEETGEAAAAEREGGYRDRLGLAWRAGFDALPAATRVRPAFERAVERCADGQRLTHAAVRGGSEELEQWARSFAIPGYRWWEVAAGASSSVAAHALIAAAADPHTASTEAEAIDAAYFPSIGALTVILDDLVDREADLAAGEHSYLAYYENAEEAAERLVAIAAEADTAVATLARPTRHAAILAGVAAFYLSSPETGTAFARPIRDRLLASLGPAVGLLSAFVRLRGSAAEP
jgi:tetraprenyl-beta-curcumene synthase